MSTPVIQKGLPFDAGSGATFPQIMAAPHRLVFDSTSTPADGKKTGNIYKAFGDVVNVANQFQGPVEIYIQNGSVPPAGNYTMPKSWYLSCDSGGVSFLSGTYFSTSPIAIMPDCAATLAFHEASGGSTFTMTNPMMTITTCSITMGTNGTLIDGTAGGGLFLRATDILSSGGQTLMTGTANTVTALDITTIPSNMLPASMTIQYDSTSHVNSQNGNTGVALFTALSGATGPTGATGATGPAGPAGTGGGATYIPATEPPDNNQYVLNIDASGNATWQPKSGYSSSFSIGQSNVEIGTSIASISYTISANFSPTSIVVSCTNPGGTVPANQTTATGTFSPTGGFSQTVPGTSVTISYSCTDPSGAPHNGSLSVTWEGKVIWGSVTPPLTAGQALWNTLNGDNEVLDNSGGHHSPLSFTSSSGQDQVFARLSTYGTPTLTDSGGDQYPATLVGTVNVTENGVPNVSYSFFYVGAPGLTFSWNL